MRAHKVLPISVDLAYICVRACVWASVCVNKQVCASIYKHMHESSIQKKSYSQSTIKKLIYLLLTLHQSSRACSLPLTYRRGSFNSSLLAVGVLSEHDLSKRAVEIERKRVQVQENERAAASCLMRSFINNKQK